MHGALTVRFDDQSVADHLDEQVEQGRWPEQFARIWMHTHPGDCPHPSCTDEETFARCFGGSDWALMFILARGGRTSARLRFVDRRADGQAQFDPDLVVFRPGREPLRIVTNAVGETVVTARSLEAVQQAVLAAIHAIERGDQRNCASQLEAAKMALLELLPPPFSPLPPLEIG